MYISSAYVTTCYRLFLVVALMSVVALKAGAQYAQQAGPLYGTGASGSPMQGNAVAVSADGNTMVVGGDVDNSYRGAVWIFTRAGTVWSQQGSKLTGSDESGNGLLGFSVAISADGNTVIAGAPSDSTPPFAAGSIGAAFVFVRSG